uniref:Uncharacterized protein n=1 Tax=Rhizophora mucronata TaxID=61149 RepID=A0A2P2N8B5_RHIMU
MPAGTKVSRDEKQHDHIGGWGFDRENVLDSQTTAIKHIL